MTVPNEGANSSTPASSPPIRHLEDIPPTPPPKDISQKNYTDGTTLERAGLAQIATIRNSRTAVESYTFPGIKSRTNRNSPDLQDLFMAETPEVRPPTRKRSKRLTSFFHTIARLKQARRRSVVVADETAVNARRKFSTLLRGMSRRRLQNGKRSASTEEDKPSEQVIASSSFSTVPPRRRRNNISNFIGRFTSSSSRSPDIGTTQTEQVDAGITFSTSTTSEPPILLWQPPNVQEDEIVVDGLEPSNSTTTLFQDSSSLYTAAETAGSAPEEDEEIHIYHVDIEGQQLMLPVILPARKSVTSDTAKSPAGSERADDDTIKGAAGVLTSRARFSAGSRQSLNSTQTRNNANFATTSGPHQQAKYIEHNVVDLESLPSRKKVVTGRDTLSQTPTATLFKPKDSSVHSTASSVNSMGSHSIRSSNKDASSDVHLVAEGVEEDFKARGRYTQDAAHKPTSRRWNITKTGKGRYSRQIPEFPIASGPAESEESGDTSDSLKADVSRRHQKLPYERVHSGTPIAEQKRHSSSNTTKADSPYGTVPAVDIMTDLDEETEHSIDGASIADNAEHDDTASYAYSRAVDVDSSPGQRVSRISSVSSDADPFVVGANMVETTRSSFGDMSDVSKMEWPVESAWETLNSATPNDRTPARLSNSRLAHIPIHFFDGLVNLKELYLDRNLLRDVPEELLRLTKLEILDLSSNCISDFPHRLKLRRLRNLRRFNLDNNALTDITAVFKLKTLRELRANNNFLNQISPEIAKLHKLRYLFLENNELTGLPDAIGRLKYLTELRLSNNSVRTIPPALCTLRQLQVLDLRSNLLTHLPDNVREMENLGVLDLACNQLTVIPSDIVKCSKLKHLDLQTNMLETLPVKMGQLARLEYLNLRNNQLSTVPADMAKLSALTELDLSHNELTSLPDDLGRLSKLIEIKLNNNRLLSTLPETFRKLSHVQQVHLQQCNIFRVGFDMGVAYPELRSLNLSGNTLDVMPKLDGMVHLEELYISNNRISDLTDQIDQLVSLQRLSADGNNLKNVPIAFGRLRNLESADLSDNALESLPSSIGDCQSLRVLKLKGNPLTSIPASLCKLPTLTTFHVGDWPQNGFVISREEGRSLSLKMAGVPYQHKVPQHVERTLLWRMHDSILKRLKEMDKDIVAESLRAGSPDLYMQQDANSAGRPPSPLSTLSTHSHHSTSTSLTPIGNGSTPREDVILKMAVLKGVYDQIMRDMRSAEYEGHSSGDEGGGGKSKNRFKRLNKFLGFG